jgi:hypothetical protein
MSFTRYLCDAEGGWGASSSLPDTAEIACDVRGLLGGGGALPSQLFLARACTGRRERTRRKQLLPVQNDSKQICLLGIKVAMRTLKAW